MARDRLVMGRGHRSTADASVALRALPGGRGFERVQRQPPLDADADHLWLTARDGLIVAAQALGRFERLGEAAQRDLAGLLDELSARIGLAPGWHFLLREDERGTRQVTAGDVFAVTSTSGALTHVAELGDRFTGGTIDGMSEARYLGRRMCELPGWVAAQHRRAPAELLRVQQA